MTKRINLALQGGGAHGAFTWGVLDRLLQETDLEIAAISGTSAGALNGAALKAGMAQGGREGARENLDWLWEQIGATGDTPLSVWMRPFMPSPGMLASLIERSPGFRMSDASSRVFSPYDYGALYKNPLKAIVEQFRFDTICSQDGPALFISATNVRSGKIRVFDAAEITTDIILASACLPTVFQAVEVLDTRTNTLEAYWDGGYTGNPALFPLFAPDLPEDVVIVNINLLYRKDVPVAAHDIQNRINEISFNSSLLRELRAIDFVKELIATGKVAKDAMKDVRVHMIADDDLMRSLSVATKMIPVPHVLSELKTAGQQAAEKFLTQNKASLSHAATLDVRSLID